MPSIKITYLNTQLKKVRDFIESTLVPYQIDPVHINLVSIAVEEICSNAIEHSDLQDHTKDFINITIYPHVEGEMARLDVEIIDCNRNFFSLENYDTPDIHKIVQDKRSGGIGLILVKHIAQEINFKREAEHNICQFSTRVPVESVPKPKS